MAKTVTFTIKARDAFTAVANKVAASTKKMKDSFKGFGELGKKLKKVFGNIAKKIATLGTAILSFIGITRLASQGSAFEAAIADLSAITGAAGEDLKFLSDQSLILSRTFARSAAQTAGAFKLVASGKPELLENGKALKDVTEQVLLLSAASGIELATSAGVTTKALNQMGQGAEEAARFVNVLAAGSKFGSSEVGETGEAIVKAGTAAKLAGVNFEQLNGVIQVLAQKGISGAIAGTQLKTALLRLETSGKKKITPSVVGFEKALENLKKMRLTSKQLSNLFGLEAINTGLVLAQEADAIVEMTRKVTGTKVAVEQARIRMATFGFSFKRIMTSIDNVLIKVYARIAQTDGFKKLADDFQFWIDSFSDEDINNIATAITLIADTMSFLGKVIVQVTKGLTGFGMEFSALKGLWDTGDIEAYRKASLAAVEMRGGKIPLGEFRKFDPNRDFVPDFSGFKTLSGDFDLSNVIKFPDKKDLPFDFVNSFSKKPADLENNFRVVPQSVTDGQVGGVAAQGRAQVEILVRDKGGNVESVKQTGSTGEQAPQLNMGINNA